MKTISTLVALCAGNSPVIGEFPHEGPVTRSFDVFLNLRLKSGWVNNRDVGDLRRHGTHHDVTVMGNPTSCLTSNERLRNDMCRKGSAKRCIWKNNWGCEFCSQYFMSRNPSQADDLKRWWVPQDVLSHPSCTVCLKYSEALNTYVLSKICTVSFPSYRWLSARL